MQPRSDDYLFVAAVDDARASWVNPAGLGWIPEASLMAGVAFERPLSNGLRLSQYVAGFNSRGFSVAYLKDRSVDSLSASQWRFALGLPLANGSVGAAVGLYRGAGKSQGVDVGLRYPVIGTVDLGLVVRNMGRPLVRGAADPITAIGGATWTAWHQAAQLSVEALATERLGGASGYEMRYRGGVALRTTVPWPVALHVAGEASSDGKLRRWSVGVIVGRLNRIGVAMGATPAGGLGRVDSFNAVGLASARPMSYVP